MSSEENGSDLKLKAVSGMAWTTFSSVTMRILAGLSNLVLAKLLAPEVFGIVSIANIVIGAMELFSDFGVGKALIRYKGDVRTAANVSFTLRLIQGVVLFGIALVLADYLAIYYKTPELKAVISVLGANFLIMSMGAIPVALLSKDMKFKQQALPQILPAFLQMVTAITLALMGFGVWSIVFGMVIFVTSQSALYWFASPIKLKFQIRLDVVKELMSFALPLFASGFVIYASFNIDRAVIGKVLGLDALGYYFFAFTVIFLPTTEIVYLVNRVMYPVYAKFSDLIWDLKNAYVKTLRYVFLVSVPLCIGIPLFGGNLFIALYGDKWVNAIVPMQVMGVFAFMRAFGATTGNVFLALGKTKYLFANAAISLILAALFVYPAATRYGITGVAGLYSSVWVIGVVILIIWLKKLINLKPAEIAVLIWKPLLASAISMGPVKALSGKVDLSIIYILLPAIVIMVVIYFAIIILIDDIIKKSLVETIKTRRPALY